MATPSHLGISRFNVLIIGIGGILLSSLLLEKALTQKKPEVSASHAAKITTTPSPIQQTSYINDFSYPNAKTTQHTTEKITQQTYDQPLLITNWYKNQLSIHAFTTTTVIQTNTNNMIENKLVGVKDNQTIAIAISKQPSEGVTYIEVSTK